MHFNPPELLTGSVVGFKSDVVLEQDLCLWSYGLGGD